MSRSEQAAGYHWILTLETGSRAGCERRVVTQSGTITSLTAATRGRAYNSVVDCVKRDLGLGEDEPAAVLFFALELNQPQPPAGCLEDAAAELRKARENNEERARFAAELEEAKLPAGDLRREISDRNMELAAGFTRLAAIERGLLPPEMTPDDDAGDV